MSATCGESRTLSLLSNQVATGLALTIFGTGLSALVGLDYVGKTIEQIRAIHIPVLTDLPVVGRLLFGHDPFRKALKKDGLHDLELARLTSPIAINTAPGAALAHDSALKHATGQAVYIDDMPLPAGTLHIAVGGADTTVGTITEIDLESVRTAPGVIDVFCAADIPGENDVSPSGRGDEP